MSKEILFEGQPTNCAGLSNENELMKMCPKKFKEANQWSEYTNALYWMGGDITKWKWKTNDHRARQKQIACFNAIMRGPKLSIPEKGNIAGWMLSEMLSEFPILEFSTPALSLWVHSFTALDY